MKVLVLTGAAVLIALKGVAYAAQLLTPPLPTSVGTSGACYVRNTGNTAVAVDVDVFSNNGLSVSFDNCNGAPLAPGRTCVVLVNDLPDDSYVACSVNSAIVGKIRGTMEVRQNSPVLKVLVSEDLR